MNDGEISALIHSEDMVNAVSDLVHREWAVWMAYVLARSEPNDDGSMTIPTNLVEKWQRQLHTSYENLSDAEKLSDQRSARAFLSTVERIMLNAEFVQEW